MQRKKQSGSRCVVKNCLNGSYHTFIEGCSLFRFPKDTERCRLWVAACKNDVLKNKTPLQLYQSNRVCSIHFTNNMFLNDLKNRLQSHALPVQNLPDADDSSNEVLIGISSSQSERLPQNLLQLFYTLPSTSKQQEQDKKGAKRTFCDEIQLSSDDQNISSLSSPKAVQTSSTLSACSPRKTKLRQKITKLQRSMSDSKVRPSGTKRPRKAHKEKLFPEVLEKVKEEFVLDDDYKNMAYFDTSLAEFGEERSGNGEVGAVSREILPGISHKIGMSDSEVRPSGIKRPWKTDNEKFFPEVLENVKEEFALYDKYKEMAYFDPSVGEHGEEENCEGNHAEVNREVLPGSSHEIVMSHSGFESSGIKRPRKTDKEKLLPEVKQEWFSDEEYNEMAYSDSSDDEFEEEESDLENQTEAFQPPALSSISIWSENHPFPSQKQIPFQGSPGFQNAPETPSPISFFLTIATVDFFKLVVSSTNSYGGVVLRCRKVQTAFKRYPVKEEEMKIFLGILYHMGTIRLNRIIDYWKKDVLFNISLFSHCMNYYRFSLIFRALHFFEGKSGDTFQRISPIIDYFNETMKRIYSPFRELSIVESTILWQGRLIFRHHIERKRNKPDIKLYMLTEVNGLVLKIMVCAASEDKHTERPDNVTNVVKKLMTEKLGLGHSVHIDNFHNSIDLTKYLLSQKTYCTGTLCSTGRNNPVEVITKKLKNGEEVHRYSEEGICVMKWKHRKEVLVVSSEYDASMVEVENRKREKKIKPKIVVEYKKSMKKVDEQDDMLTYYPIERKTPGWYKKVGIHIFHLILVNSYKLYKLQFKTNFYDFRLEIIKSLLSSRLQTTLPPPYKLPKNPYAKRARRKQ